MTGVPRSTIVPAMALAVVLAVASLVLPRRRRGLLALAGGAAALSVVAFVAYLPVSA